jgi:catechol 2,3-dioxygenase-like lactoylglutathione lyase family enzyme
MLTFTRRELLMSLGAFAALSGDPLLASFGGQSGRPPIRVRTLNHFGIAVSDPKRSIDFYQELFGMPVQARMGTTTVLRVGAGPQFLSIRPLEGDASAAITHFGLGIEAFSVDGVMAALATQGVTRADAIGALKATVTMRDGSSDVRFGDPDGIVCQLNDVTFCGGSGPLGNRCVSVETARSRGLIALSDLSHLTIFPSDAQRSNQFYRELFGFSIRSYQGPAAPTLAVGPTAQFLMFAGGAGGRGGTPAAPRRATINHACWSLDGFKPDEVLKRLETFGVKAREATQGPVGPLRHYVTMRMENRGGAPGGTPELYFTDPDGLLMQLQDTAYCGGGGFLGNECPKV